MPLSFVGLNEFPKQKKEMFHLKSIILCVVQIIASVYQDTYRIVKTYYSTKQYAGPGYFYFILLMHQYVESKFVITFHFIAHDLYVYTSSFFLH